MTATDLYAAILADPLADVPRLIYADFLEEFGDEGERAHAEFVRVQIALAAIKGSGDSLRERELWDSRRGDGDWHIVARDLPGKIDRQHIDQETFSGRIASMVLWRRGFIDEIRCPMATWKKHGKAIVLAHPVTRVRLVDREPIADDGDRIWMRKLKDVADSSGTLPLAWWRHLSGPGCVNSKGCRHYDTADLAHADLSRVLVNWARKLAGLPALEGL